MKAVTVVIANHNYGRFIKDALRSVVNQQYPRIQVVVIDDGSTDGSFEVLSGYFKNAQRVSDQEPWTVFGRLPGSSIPVAVYRFEQPHGPAFARNWGIKVAWEGTDVFGILDADDVWKPGRVQRCLKVLEDPNVGLVYTDYDSVNLETDVRIREFKEAFSRERLWQECIVTNACFITKTTLDACGGYDEQMRVCEDYDLFLRIADHSLIAHVPESLVDIRVGSHNSTATVPREVWEQNWQRVHSRVLSRQGH